METSLKSFFKKNIMFIKKFLNFCWKNFKIMINLNYLIKTIFSSPHVHFSDTTCILKLSSTFFATGFGLIYMTEKKA